MNKKRTAGCTKLIDMMIHKDVYNEEDDINENATILVMNKITPLGASKFEMLINRGENNNMEEEEIDATTTNGTTQCCWLGVYAR